MTNRSKAWHHSTPVRAIALPDSESARPSLQRLLTAIVRADYVGERGIWTLGRPAVSSVIIAARKPGRLEQNIRATDLDLSEEDLRLLGAVSDPGVPYPKWMVLQLDTAEDPRSHVLHPERYAKGGP